MMEHDKEYWLVYRCALNGTARVLVTVMLVRPSNTFGYSQRSLAAAVCRVCSVPTTLYGSGVKLICFGGAWGGGGQ